MILPAQLSSSKLIGQFVYVEHSITPFANFATLFRVEVLVLSLLS